MINKKELKYLLYATGFAFIIFGIILPNLIKGGVENTNPYIQFLVFNVGIFFFLQIFLKGFVNDTKFSWKTSLGLLFIFMALDIMAPPMMVSIQGTLQTGVVLSASASDYIVGDLILKTSLTGFPVYLITYIITPFILLFLSGLLLKDFVKEL